MTGTESDRRPDSPEADSTKTASPLELGDLPASYGKDRLVLLPVDPFLMHVYWDVGVPVPPAAGARAILRFYESPSLDDETLQSRPFDIAVNLAVSRWYVNLWSPDKTYYADLGWEIEDGTFIPLARSNAVRTPPAWPRAAGPIEIVEENAPPPNGAIDASPPQPSDEIVGSPIAEEVAPAPIEIAPPVHEPLDQLVPFDETQEIPGEPSQLDTPMPAPWSSYQEVDLTQLSEERFTPGISSRWEPLGK